MKRGFTLVELLIVIGIIGILSAVLMVSFKGSTESARAAKCLNNMHNLAQACIGKAMRNEYGYMPYAGTWVATQSAYSNGKLTIYYYQNTGWIDWLDRSDDYNARGTKSSYPTSYMKVNNCSAFTESEEDAVHAIENGSLWDAVNHDRSVYVCPTHKIVAAKKGKTPQWSYAMSAYFGYDASNGAKAGGWVVTMSSSRLDRKLLFAELPYAQAGSMDNSNNVDDNIAYNSSDGNTYTDPILQYSATVDGTKYHDSWDGTPEAIAFNHKVGKDWCAHVVFADGHTEKLVKAKSEGGLDAATLTAALCEGLDIGFDGKRYELLNQKDDVTK